MRKRPPRINIPDAASGEREAAGTCEVTNDEPAVVHPHNKMAKPELGAPFAAAGDALDAALGRHLELLGQALRQRRQHAAPQASTDDNEEGTESTAEVGLRSALADSAEAVARELCPSDFLARRISEVMEPEPTEESRCEPSTPPPHQDKAVTYVSEVGSDTGGTAAHETTSEIITRRTTRKTTDLSRASHASSVSRTLSSQSRSKRWDDAPGEKGKFEAFVTSSHFEMFFAFLIGLNTVVMIIEEQYHGSVVGYQTGFYEQYGSKAYGDQYMPAAKQVFKGIEVLFACIFTIEAGMRMVVRGRGYWKDKTELVDLFVVLCSNASLIVENFSTLNITLFRVLRLAKLLRMVKLIRTVEQLDSLQLMTTALYASISALCWAVVLLFIMQSFVALILTNIFRGEYLDTDTLDNEQRRVLFEYFGTYARSMLSTFELMLANWPPICRFLSENLHEGWMVVVVIYKLTFGFAFVGVINSVFMQETLNVAVTDDNIMIKTRTRAALVHRQKMEKLMKLADSDNDGHMTLEEFEAVLTNPSVKTWLESMDVETRDAKLLFRLLDKDNDNELTLDDLVVGVGKLKGIAKSLDTQLLIQAMLRQWFPEVENNAQGDSVLLDQTAPVFDPLSPKSVQLGPLGAQHTRVSPKSL